MLWIAECVGVWTEQLLQLIKAVASASRYGEVLKTDAAALMSHRQVRHSCSCIFWNSNLEQNPKQCKSLLIIFYVFSILSNDCIHITNQT